MGTKVFMKYITKKNDLKKKVKNVINIVDLPLKRAQDRTENLHPNLAFLSPYSQGVRLSIVVPIIGAIIAMVVLSIIWIAKFKDFLLNVAANLTSIFVAALIGLILIGVLTHSKSKKEAYERIRDREKNEDRDGLIQVYGKDEQQKWTATMACFKEAKKCKHTAEEAAREEQRINCDPSYLQYLGLPIEQVICKVCQSEFYEMPGTLKSLLSGMVTDRNQHIRMLRGPVNRALVKLCSINIRHDKNSTPKQIVMELGACSFRDAFFTHYFPDYEIVKGQTPNFTLRQEIGLLVKDHYGGGGGKLIYSPNNPFGTFPLLPNHLGVTGIVEFVSQNGKHWYVLQIKSNDDAADSKKLMWSFGAMVKMFPDLWSNPDSRTLFEKEFDREIRNYEKFRNLFHGCQERECKVLGLVFNALYLYQPEIIIKISYKADDKVANELEKLVESNWINNKQKKVTSDPFVVEKAGLDKMLMEALMTDRRGKGRKIIRPRRMFYFAQRFLEMNNTLDDVNGTV